MWRSLSGWLRERLSPIATGRGERRLRRPAAKYRAHLEVLEDRWLLSTLVMLSVINTQDSGTGSLRDAILTANSDTNATHDYEIDFAITAGANSDGSFTIVPSTPLPNIARARTTINGYTQAGASENALAASDNAVLRIQLDGKNLAAGAIGLHVTGGGCTLKGLVVDHFNGSGIVLDSASNVLQGDFLGVNVAGTAALGNGAGVTDAGVGNTIGGTDVTARNLISGNTLDGVLISYPARNSVVEANFIGTDSSGGTTVPNGRNGVNINSSYGGHRVGGTFFGLTATVNNVTVLGAGNLISGNGGNGVIINNDGTAGSTIQGNRIGTTPTNAALGNAGHGISITNQVIAPVIGGADVIPEAGFAPNDLGNIIANNGGDGIHINGGSANGLISGTVIQGNSISDNGLNGISIAYGTKTKIGAVGFASEGQPLAGQLLANTIEARQGNAVNIVSGTDNAIVGNSLSSFSGLAIQLASGANRDQCFPILSTGVLGTIEGTGGLVPYTEFKGSLKSAANTSFLLDYGFVSPGWPGQSFTLEREQYPVTTGQAGSDGLGTAPVDLILPWFMDAIDATATHITVDTSGRVTTTADTSEVSPTTRAFWTADTLQAVVSQAADEGLTGYTIPTEFYDSTGLNAFLTALSSVTSSSAFTFTANLTGQFGDVVVSLQPNVRLQLTGTQTNLLGNSPALTVTSGTVMVTDVTFGTATDSPTILVTGGKLILRDDIVQESTGFTDAAIAVTGGTVDLGTTTEAGGNTLDINGTGQFIQTTSASSVSFAGNTFEVDGTVVPTPFLSNTKLSSSANPSTLYQPVTFTAVVSTLSGMATGYVDFMDMTTHADLGMAPLSGGKASLTVSSLGVRDHVIVALYGGDGTFSPSSDRLTQSVHYNFSGFMGPLQPSGTYALGRTLPILFQLRDFYGNPIGDLNAVTSLQIQRVNAHGQPLAPPSNPQGAGHTGLRYDPTGNQFVFNWDTKGLDSGYFEILLTLADGTVQSLVVQLR